MKKTIFIISILIFALFLNSCEGLDALPTIANLEETIETIINSKGENYDFLKDELYIEKMNELVEKLIDEDILEPESFVFGNLDDDTIPEIVVFRQREIDNLEDAGYLEVYKFDGKTYSLLDSIDMNYDTNNYDLKIGKISSDENGIYLSNKVGKGFGFTYGFVLRDGKLKSILNEKKLNLISIEPINEIKDIDEDGILEFSIYTVDPESKKKETEDKDKLILWYKWDGRDSADLIKMERIKVEGDKDIESHKDVFEDSIELLKDGDSKLIKYLKENSESLSNKDINKILKTHISNLQSKIGINSLKLKDLYEDYKIPLNKINDIEYLKSEDVLLLDEEIKKNIIENLKLGYKIELKNKDYEYEIDYDMFLNEFGENMTNQYKDYLKIIKLENCSDLDLQKHIQNIVMMENFLNTYPYSNSLEEIKDLLNKNIDIFLEKLSQNPLTEEERIFIEENYSHTYLYEKIENLPNQ